MNQIEKILALMIKRKDIQTWFKATDFCSQNLGDFFIGYEASARMSDCMKQYPHLVEAGRDGRFRTLRFRFEDLESIMKNSSKDLVAFLDSKFLEYGVRKISQPAPKKEVASLF